MTSQDSHPVQPPTPPAPQRRPGAPGSLRRVPPTPRLVTLVFWLDIVWAVGATVLSLGTLAPFAAAIALLAFAYRRMGRAALWARGIVAVLLGALSLLGVGTAVQRLIEFDILDSDLVAGVLVLAWQIVAAVGIVQALRAWRESDEEQRARFAERHPPTPGKRSFWRRRHAPDVAVPPALIAVLSIDVVISLTTLITAMRALRLSREARVIGGDTQFLFLAFPALFLALLCWEKNPLALVLRIWFGAGVALVSGVVLGPTSPWTLGLALYALIAGLLVVRSARRIATEERAAQTPPADSGSAR